METMTDWVKWLADAGKQVKNQVSPKLEAFKEKINKLYKKHFEETVTVLKSRSAFERLQNNSR